MSVEKLDFSCVIKEQIPYTVLSTKVIQAVKDPLAGFIWVYLSSLPPDWKINKTQLRNHFGIGIGKLKSALAYLNKSRLIEYVQLKDGQSHFCKMAINVLCGDKFVNIQEVASAGRVSVPPEIRSTGKQLPTKEIDNTKEIKDKNFCAPSEARKGFDEFYNAYPKKKNRKLAEKTWIKNKCYLIVDKILADIKERRAKDSQWQALQYIPYPTTYLNGERWEDEITIHEPQTPNFSHSTAQATRPNAVEWGKGHPGWEALHGKKMTNKDVVNAKESDLSRNSAWG